MIPEAYPAPGSPQALSEDERLGLEWGLSRRLGERVRIERVAQGDEPHWSTHAIARLEVLLDSGEVVPVVLKRPGVQVIDPGWEELPRGGAREVPVYRRLLQDGRFGAPFLYASRYDPEPDRCWLIVEDVGSLSLVDAELETWLSAARWMARMHATFYGRERELRQHRCLAEHDMDYYQTLARIARQNLGAVGSPLLERFDLLMHPYEGIIRHLVRFPRTLVHGDIFPDNLMVQEPATIRPIDWESAGIGLPAWDLVRLADDWGPDTERFTAAYLSEFEQYADSPVERAELEALLAHCAIVNVVRELAWERDPCGDATFVDEHLEAIVEGMAHSSVRTTVGG